MALKSGCFSSSARISIGYCRFQRKLLFAFAFRASSFDCLKNVFCHFAKIEKKSLADNFLSIFKKGRTCSKNTQNTIPPPSRCYPYLNLTLRTKWQHIITNSVTKTLLSFSFVRDHCILANAQSAFDDTMRSFIELLERFCELKLFINCWTYFSLLKSVTNKISW